MLLNQKSDTVVFLFPASGILFDLWPQCVHPALLKVQVTDESSIRARCNIIFAVIYSLWETLQSALLVFHQKLQQPRAKSQKGRSVLTLVRSVRVNLYHRPGSPGSPGSGDYRDLNGQRTAKTKATNRESISPVVVSNTGYQGN